MLAFRKTWCFNPGMSRVQSGFWPVFLALVASGPVLAADLRDMKLLEDDRGTRAVLEVGGMGQYKVFTLANPDRLVLDLDQAQLARGFRLPAPNGAVANVRTGMPSPGTLRIVFDLGSAVGSLSRVERDGSVSRLVIELGNSTMPTSVAKPELAVQPQPVQPQPAAEPVEFRIDPTPIPAPISAPPLADTALAPIVLKPLENRVATEAMPPTRPALQRAKARAAGRTVQDVIGNSQRKLVVAIDAGHGGKDPGAHGPSGVREKAITLAVARELARQINADPGMRAVLIRDGDTFVPLKQRYMKARAAQADLFISIHADASPNDEASGASVFVLSTRGASSQAARWLADQENAADLVGGVTLDQKDPNLAAVLLDLSQSATMRASDDIANQVLGALKNVGKAHKPALERANFVVLRSPDVPSMLIETGFITNPSEEQRLNDAGYRSRLALAIATGVRKYFTDQAPAGSWYANRGSAGSGNGETDSAPWVASSPK